ncbi:MAG: hypothetical protein JWO38_592 [Gemmataceae bacterium]|nr:hypothetical protein [Gemmataceae bacterium]
MEPHRGTLILILGVLSLVVTPLIGPFAWWMGATDLRKMQTGVMDPDGENETRIGYILGVIATVLLMLVVLVILAVIALVVFAGVAANAGR